MPLLENSDSVAKMIRDGLTSFAAAQPNLYAERAVVWFDPEHEHCALYISADAQTPKLLPTNFDFQNFAVTDVLMRGDYEDRREEFWRDAERLVRDISRELPSAINPKLWAVQVGFEHYNEWKRSNDIKTSMA